MITRGATDLKTRRKKKETTLRDAIMNSLKWMLECDGFEATKEWYKQCRANFAEEDDWPSIDKEAFAFICEAKKLQEEKEHQQQMDIALIKGISKGGNVGQQNILFGSTTQASYSTTKSNME